MRSEINVSDSIHDTVQYALLMTAINIVLEWRARKKCPDLLLKGWSKKSCPTQLFEPRITDAKVMRDLVDHGLLNLRHYFFFAGTVSTDRHLIQGYPVRQDRTVTDGAPLREWYAFVKAEERASFGLVINEDDEVLDLSGEFGW